MRDEIPLSVSEENNNVPKTDNMQFMFSVLLWQISNWTLHVTKIKEPKLLTQRGNLTDIFFEKMLCTPI